MFFAIDSTVKMSVARTARRLGRFFGEFDALQLGPEHAAAALQVLVNTGINQPECMSTVGQVAATARPEDRRVLSSNASSRSHHCALHRTQ